MERILEYHEIPNHKRVKVVAIKLKGRASAWCKQFQMLRVRMGKRKIQEWPKMKKALEKQFLAFNYMQSLYKNLHNLRQTSSVDDYNEKFYKFLSKLDLQETEEQQILRYLSGLKPSIQDSLSMYPLCTLFEAYSRAIMMER